MAPDTAPAVAFVTLGCPKNEVDSDRMRAAVAASRFQVAENPSDADILVVNTCSFIEAATTESIDTVLEATGGWATERAGRRVVVAGCMPSRYGSELTQALPEVEAFVPVSEEHDLLGVLHRLTGFDPGPTPQTGARRAHVGPSAYLQVADGCHRACTFCTIPSIRGPYVSRPLQDLVAEAGELVAAGAREIVLIGQDISAYGRDRSDGLTLADVVAAIARVEGVAMLRLMYVQPDGVTDRLLDVMAAHDNVCRYLDMPLQHAARDVLRAMGRSGDARSFLELVKRIRTALPGVVLRTTLIAGFPGETRAHVSELMRFLEAARLDYVGVFTYSPEEGTVAGELPEQVPQRTKRARAQRLRDLSDAIGFERAAQHVDQTLHVLVESFDEDLDAMVGRYCGQAPEVDGVVILDAGEPGQIVKALVTETCAYDMFAQVQDA